MLPPTSNKNCSPASTSSGDPGRSSQGDTLRGDSVPPIEYERYDSDISRLAEEKRFRMRSLFSLDRFCSFDTMSPAVIPVEMSTAMQTRVKSGALTRMI